MKQNVHVFDLPGKSLMLAFESDRKDETWAVNAAISSVMKEYNLQPFHQIGSDPWGNNQPGFHGWENWANASRELMESLIPLVEERAEKFLEMW